MTFDPIVMSALIRIPCTLGMAKHQATLLNWSLLATKAKERRKSECDVERNSDFEGQESKSDPESEGSMEDLGESDHGLESGSEHVEKQIDIPAEEETVSERQPDS